MPFFLRFSPLLWTPSLFEISPSPACLNVKGQMWESVDEIAKKIERDNHQIIMIHGHSQLGNDNAAIPIGRRHNMLGQPGSLNTITPCAACKLLRRRCAEECPFSPFFSPHEPHKFAAVHKVFGASNVSKMLMEVPDSQRADAANSLVYEANLRIRDPVYGCMGAISALQHQIQTLQGELDGVRAEILRYKYREATINPNSINHPHNNANNIGNGPVTLMISGPTSTLSCTSTDAPPQRQPHPPPPPPSAPSSMMVSSTSSSSSSTSSIYTTPTANTTTAYSSISSDHNVAYFE